MSKLTLTLIHTTGLCNRPTIDNFPYQNSESKTFDRNKLAGSYNIICCMEYRSLPMKCHKDKHVEKCCGQWNKCNYMKDFTLQLLYNKTHTRVRHMIAEQNNSRL